MPSEFFKSRTWLRTLRDGPEGPRFERFARALREAGYATITARRHIRAAKHFIYWAQRHSTLMRELNERSLAGFKRHLNRCRCSHYGHSKQPRVVHAVRLFLTFLQDARILALHAKPLVHDPALLSAFRQWMRQQRGITDLTLYQYSIYIRALLGQLGVRPSCFDARRLRAFVLDRSHSWGPTVAQKCTTALRMFLRFLIAEGKCRVGLDAAIPTSAHWRLAALPRYFQPEEVERLIASCDQASVVGWRDRAILLLLARLGLRAADIVHLRLSDIDWKGAWIRVCGKGRRHTRLPLTQEVGDAIVSYLNRARPRTNTDTVFVRCRAPFCAFSSSTVSHIVEKALRLSGVRRPSRGAAHLLRHSLATSMLRQGASLEDIAPVLRHRSIETTEIYAKVDVMALRQIAQPWPEA